ncbi:hypothetical protein ESCO_003329 [Escovopsis weberi]|uniref:FAD dependent oxidoreductase domain-containing protein n=1 Tax=Escovopsis weberi TaxID=150374 RepID=A0A0M9VSH6_ESCWE|nr:hypothetical protein ESCO_003329 [Escovopsis weberi]
MGGAISRLAGDLRAAHLVKMALALGTSHRALLRRASSDPGLPVESPTPSTTLPADADVAIIGSDITGAAAARTLCELAVRTADLFLDEDDFRETRESVEALARGLPRVDVQVWEADAARCADLRISTHTSVEGVDGDSGDAERPYAVRTSRGEIHARHVLHATNGFAGHLVPVLRGRLTGVLGHMTAQRPENDFPRRRGMISWSVIHSPGFDYASQRPEREDGSAGDLMLGGGLSRSKDGGLDQFGVWDDGRIDAFPLMHLRGSMATVFEPKWGAGGELISAWTGIMGFTGDALPFVGWLPPDENENENENENEMPRMTGFDSHGQWIAAGFNGEGMV